MKGAVCNFGPNNVTLATTKLLRSVLSLLPSLEHYFSEAVFLQKPCTGLQES